MRLMVAALSFSVAWGALLAAPAKKDAQEGARRYDQGDYEGALPFLEKAAEKGVKDGQTYYQLAYIYDRRGDRQRAQAQREKAAPLLAKQASSSKGTLEDSYYLTALYAQLQRTADMQAAAAAGIERFGKKEDLSGDDLFRLGRLYQFAGRAELSAASYRKAAAAMGQEKNPNPIFYSLALTADASTDFQARRYADAARKLEQAESLSPANAPSPFQTALAELGAGRYAQAREHFDKVREEGALTEAQYGSALATHLEKAGGRLEADAEGKGWLEMDNQEIQDALAEAAEAYRTVHSTEKGEPDLQEENPATAPVATDSPVAPAEKLFFSLAAEWMLRGNSLRELSLSGNYADLIRR
jgi:Flp pilus assembly protein TadD